MILERKAELTPGREAAFQWPDAANAALPEEQRHTGAGGFVGSSTVEHDVTVAWDEIIVRL
jgi:hypothetical protein